MTSVPISPVSSFHCANPANDDEADPRISDGSRGGAVDGARDPPPYMPDAIAVPREGSVGAGIGTSLEASGKDQNYLGLRS
jgi:hypothetical protein